MAAAAVLAPAASAAISPTVSLNQSAGTAAGSTVNLGMDLKFAPSGGDSPKNLTLTLPPGLLANAAIDGGACLKSTVPNVACQVGSGSISASETELGVPVPVPVSIPVTFDLIGPPASGDLAGLAIESNGSELGTPGAVTVRSSGNPAGVGLNIAFTNLPDTYTGLPIAVDELNNTFDGLRLPDACPGSPAPVIVSANSYGDATTQTASAPLEATDCSALPFAPVFKVTAARDRADTGVKVVTVITQKPDEATSATVALALPVAVLSPNVAAVLSGGILCANPSLAGCKTIGSASATSPLYPQSLTGRTYLTGSLTAPAITIAFPAPFALTLNGAVDLATNTTTFTGVPDIPLTDLTVTLAGGPDAVFMTTCASASGTATATLTSQNADHVASPSSAFTVSGCTPSTGGGTGGSGPGGRGGTTPGAGATSHAGRPRIVLASLSGLKSGRPFLGFGLVAGTNAPLLRTFTIKLPRGLRFVAHRAHRRLEAKGISLEGARIRSVALHHGRLTVTLRRPVSSVIVQIRHRALAERASLRARARRRRIRSLKLTVIVRDVKGKRTTLSQAIRRLGL